MQYRSLGRSGLKVSEIGLGSNSFGGATGETDAIKIIDYAIDAGINFIDAADIYLRGRSEEVIGKGVKGRRSKVIIGSKFSFPMGEGINEQGASRHYIMQAVEASLRRLNTDYLDLYYVHRSDPSTPIEETLRAMDDLVRSGKVRYIGCSNFPAWKLCEAQWVSKMGNLESFVVVQSQYSMLFTDIEVEVVPCCQQYGVGVIPWAPLARGLLTDGLTAFGPFANSTMTESNVRKTRRLKDYAAQKGHKLEELAIAWLLGHPYIPSVIAGATLPEQLTANIFAAEWKLSADEMKEIQTLL